MSMDIAVYRLLKVLPTTVSATDTSRVIAVPEASLPLIESLLSTKLQLEDGKDFAVVHIAFEELGYMRKPFRDMDDTDTAQDESEEFIANNIKTAVRNIDRSQYPALSDSNFAILGFEDLELLDEVGQYSYDPDMWKASITDVISKNTLVVLDW